jgi:hypothetical protein
MGVIASLCPSSPDDEQRKPKEDIVPLVGLDSASAEPFTLPDHPPVPLLKEADFAAQTKDEDSDPAVGGDEAPEEPTPTES